MSFQAYIDAALAPVRTWSNVKGTKASTCPPLLSLKRIAMSHYGYPAGTVLAMPFLQLRYEVLAALESDGVLEFFTADDAEIEKETDRLAAEIRAEIAESERSVAT